MAEGEQAFDAASGRLDPAAAYACPDTFAREQHAIFDQAWQLVGPAEWLASPGDYVNTRFGARPVLLWRGRDGIARVAENLCPGIGGKPLANAGRGSAFTIDCACHGWRHTPERLGPGGQLREYRGLLFASLSTDPPPFPCTGDAFGWHLGAMLDCIAETVTLAGKQPLEWRVGANWKLAAQQFCGDMARRRLMADDLHEVLNLPPAWSDPPALQLTTPAGAALLADEPALPRILTGTLFPNLCIDGFTCSVHLFNPLDPALTQVRSFSLVSPAADACERRAALRRMTLLFGPTGFASMADAECWTAATRNAQLAPRPVDLADSDAAKMTRNLPGTVFPAESDAGQRAFLGWWQQQLDRAPAPRVERVRITAPREASGAV